MLQAFQQFLSELSSGTKDQSRFQADDYRLAAAALLVHAAMIDGAIADIERNRLHALLRLRFDLSEQEAGDLLAKAAEAESEAIDLYRFTSLLNRSLDDNGRLQIVEMLWEIAYADGHVTEFEDNLIWRAADLLHVPTRARVELRARVSADRKLGSRQSE
jgi:uncharacterized tellurite resistance protein B-like protein